MRTCGVMGSSLAFFFTLKAVSNLKFIFIKKISSLRATYSKLPSNTSTGGVQVRQAQRIPSYHLIQVAGGSGQTSATYSKLPSNTSTGGSRSDKRSVLSLLHTLHTHTHTHTHTLLSKHLLSRQIQSGSLTMVLISGGNSQHAAHAWGKMGDFGGKYPICDCYRSNVL